MMKRTMKAAFALSLAAVLGVHAAIAAGQSLPALPGEFTTDTGYAQMQEPMRAAGVSDGVQGTKANDNLPKCFADPKVTLSYGWNLNPAGQMTVNLMLKTPQDPASHSQGYINEPVSKQAYRNGVLEWRKTTYQVIGGSCEDKQLSFYLGSWMGAVGDKLVAVGVTNLYNSKDAGQGWIDQYITKVTAALSSK